jgi:membrane fusion protein, heavy metal efflux system
MIPSSTSNAGTKQRRRSSFVSVVCRRRGSGPAMPGSGWTLSGVLIVIALVAIPSGCRREEPPRATDPHQDEAADTHAEQADTIHLSAEMLRDVRLTTTVVAQRAGRQEVSVLGAVTADQDRYAEAAPPTSGQVVRILVDVDASVAPGTPLAQLRSTDLGRAHAALLTTEARRDLARQTLERKRSLAADRIVAPREVQEAEAAATAAEAEARAAATELNALGVGAPDRNSGDSSLFFIRAPIAGRVIARTAVLGRHADTDEALFTIANLDRVWVVVQVFERDAVAVATGSVAHVTLAALPGQEYDGRVTHIGRTVEPGSRTVPVRIALANPRGVFRPGMSASVRLETGGATSTIIAVPAAALQRVGDRWLVFVVRNEHEYEMRPVGRGRDLGNEVEIVSGVRPGEPIVVDGAFVRKAEAEKRSGGGDAHGH